jgi:hypothetical protein
VVLDELRVFVVRPQPQKGDPKMDNQPQSNEEPNKTLLDNEIPAKFLDGETGEIRTDALVKSYKSLEKKLSAQKRPPRSHDEYCIDCAHGMFAPDIEVNRRLHDKGLTEEQVQEVYDIAAERLIPMIADIANDFKADQEIEKLISHYGGADQWTEMSRQLLNFGQKHLPADVLDTLTSSFDGVLALERMMRSGEPVMRRSSSPVRGSLDEKELQSMMRDPKYWRDKDPAFIAKVTEGFGTLYGGA